ncbi:MAG: glycerophosphodiester phosphodiesterase [Rhodospirillales bacterium]|nr:glycerophosphodiester phosphodiesterase [Rhodospirillales bacterium]
MQNSPLWPRLIGHRGAAKWAPENTLASFFCAADMGAQWVELDVRLCKGGIPVVFHDATLERTTNGLGRVAEHRLDELKSLDAGSWFSRRFKDEPIPTLEEALDVIAKLGMGVNIELKPDPENARETARRALEAARLVWPESAPPPLISSFDAEALEEASSLGLGWPLGYLAGRFESRHLEKALALKTGSFHLAAHGLRRDQIDALHQAGLRVFTYTVNDLSQARQLLAMGVDAIFTDDPKILAPG